MPAIQEMMMQVFEEVERSHPVIFQVYKETIPEPKKLANKYAYYLASHLGMKRPWQGNLIEDVHLQVQDPTCTDKEGGVSKENFVTFA